MANFFVKICGAPSPYPKSTARFAPRFFLELHPNLKVLWGSKARSKARSLPKCIHPAAAGWINKRLPAGREGRALRNH
ncbi:MAG: hypothetical protein HYY60_00375 [Parcubacteria group bacterium]|nr:hypothetical protein [Parcubacteria group bacterium]